MASRRSLLAFQTRPIRGLMIGSANPWIEDDDINVRYIAVCR
jgi:hypothetical protein